MIMLTWMTRKMEEILIMTLTGMKIKKMTNPEEGSPVETKTMTMLTMCLLPPATTTTTIENVGGSRPLRI